MPAGEPRYLSFTRAEWAALRLSTPLTLSDAELDALRGTIEQVSRQEVEEVFLPLSRLLNLHVAARRNLDRVKDTFLGRPVGRPPYVIALAGSVAVGKSTFARVLRAILSRWPDHPRVDLVTTDGFLLPNRELEARGIMHRKGFPESYDRARMLRFLVDVKAGAEAVEAPVYSHLHYDVMPGEVQVVARPDIVIFEGLNVLQAAAAPGRGTHAIISDFSTSRFTSTPTRPTSRTGMSSGSGCCSAACSAGRGHISAAIATCRPTRPGAWRGGSGARSTA